MSSSSQHDGMKAPNNNKDNSYASSQQQNQKGKRARGKRAGKKHKKPTDANNNNSAAQQQQPQYGGGGNNNYQGNNKWGAPAKGRYPTNATTAANNNNEGGGGKSRGGRRGGKRNRRAEDYNNNNESATASAAAELGNKDDTQTVPAVAANSKAKAASTKWSALEKEWFPANKPESDKGSSEPSIPDPIVISDLVNISDGSTEELASNNNTTITSVAFHQLQHLWQNFSQKRQRQGTNTTASGDAVAWQPRPIQLQAWSILLPPRSTALSQNDATDTTKEHQRMNMIGLSPTASGKTLAFGAPMVVAAALAATEAKAQQKQQHISQSTPDNSVVGIVLVPTRELAQQVTREIEAMVSCLLPMPASSSTKKKNMIRVLTCCGGDTTQTTTDQIRILQSGPAGCQWVVTATPGRLWDIVEKCQQSKQTQQRLKIKPAYIVLDEADRLAGNLDLGQQVTSILGACISPESTSLTFFSATFPHKVQKQWKDWMKLSSQKPCAMIRVDAVSFDASKHAKRQKTSKDDDADDVVDTEQPKSDTANINAQDEDNANNMEDDDMESDGDKAATAAEVSKSTNDFLSSIPANLVQTLHVCAEHKKPKKLMHTLDRVRKEEKTSNARQKRLGIIFFGRIKTLQYISKLLQQQSSKYEPNKYECLELHSQLPQHVRTGNLQAFQAGKVPVLLATDIAARGVHISNLSFVINYDFPSSLEQYVHRCGRAGRNYQPSQDDKLPPTIYSFFTRSMAIMAPDTVALLKASKAWVDPNLENLINELGEGAKPKKKRVARDNNPKDSLDADMTDKQSNPAANDTGSEDSDSDDGDAFPELSANKIVLKRAGHVSDASSDDDESGDEE